MIRLAVILAALLPVFTARANVYSVSNDVVTFTCTDRTLPVDLRYGFRFTVKAYQGATVIDLSNRVVRYKVFDLRDGVSVQESEASVDITNDTATASLTLTGIQPGQYEGKMLSYNTNDVLVATLSCDRLAVFSEAQSIAWTNTLLTVTNLGASGGGGGSTSVTVTNLIVSTNIISVTVTNTGGGGGSGTLSGFNSATTGGVFLVVSNGWDASITNSGNIFTINTGLPKGATGVNQVATWNGTNWIATALGAPTPTPTVGTNVQKFATVWGVTNTFVAPSTQIMFTTWGATGGGSSSGAGHSRALWVGSAGTIFDIVIGTRGTYLVTTNNGPYAGRGLFGGTTNYQNGGGATYIAISGTTNIILMAGGSGGGGASASAAGGPGGFWFGSTDGANATTNASFGLGAWASNEYGQAATAGTNVVASGTGTVQNGSFLRGGNASTNGCTAGATGYLGGGGGGWYGGAGATRTNATIGTATTLGASGGGGLCYANTNFVSFAQVIAGQRAVSGVPAAQDHPTYTAGRAVGAAAGGDGTDGCAGAMW